MRIVILIVFGLGIGFFSGEGLQTRKNLPNRSPIITSFSSCPTQVVRCNSPVQFDCTAEDVSLRVVATDPDGDYLKYRYVVSDGTITGQGSSVRWNLREIHDGTFVAKVFVNDGRGAETTSELSLEVTTAVLPDPPPCPTIRVECAESVEANKHAVFTVEVAGGPAGIPFTYQWSAVSGKMVKGQGTNQI